jgi:hypothetical protein
MISAKNRPFCPQSSTILTSLVCDVKLHAVPNVRQMTSSNNGQDDVVDVRNSGMGDVIYVATYAKEFFIIFSYYN